MISREDVAKALAYFERCEDPAVLHRAIGDVAPRARLLVGRIMKAGPEDAVPPPADLRAAREPATQAQALATLRGLDDFALLQVLARGIGQRIEAMEVVASAEFPPGARVLVPERVSFPSRGARLPGVVEESGTSLTVLLDNGETWEGPPSLAVREGRP